LNLDYADNSNFIPDPIVVLLCSLGIFILGYFIASRIFRTNKLAALTIATIKSLLFFVNYIFFFNIDFFTIDSFNYMDRALRIKEISSFSDFLYDLVTFNLMHLYGLAHYVYNAFVTTLLFAFNTDSALIPIAGNIVITLLSGYVFTRILILMGMKERYAQWYFLFFVLHWEVMSYSTFSLLKDNLVCFLTICLFYFPALIHASKFKLRHIIPLLLTLWAMMFIRFYITPIFFVCYLAYLYLVVFVGKKSWSKIFLLIMAPLAFIAFVISIWDMYGAYMSLVFDFKGNPIYGIVRFFLTPQPWYVSGSYIYLLIPSILNWVVIPFTLFGIISLLRIRGLTKLLLIYYLAILIFYGVYSPHGQATGPRHKLQVVFIYALFQYIGLIKVFFPKVQLFNKVGRAI